jgi:hypothetical protein
VPEVRSLKQPTFSRRVMALAAAATALVGIAIGAARDGATDHARIARSAPDAEVRWTLLAVGDTGRSPSLLPALGGQRAVARAIALEDARHPADALALLGDNFYFDGLRPDDAVDRIGRDLVAPYCRFQALDAELSRAVEGDCPVPRAERRPIPIFAVLGNHDHGSAESAAIQSEEIPRYVSNWTLPEALARSVEAAPGVSLVLVDSTPLQDDAGPTPELVAALRAAKGPWRILVAHHPVGTSNQLGADHEGASGLYTENVRRSIEAAGVPVQLMLAGHEHNLQVIEMDGGSPSLVAVSGGGSVPRAVKSASAGRLASAASLGFVRVRLERRDGTTRLHVTPFVLTRWGSLLGASPRRLGEWSVDLAGGVRDESGRVLAARG